MYLLTVVACNNLEGAVAPYAVGSEADGALVVRLRSLLWGWNEADGDVITWDIHLISITHRIVSLLLYYLRTGSGCGSGPVTWKPLRNAADELLHAAEG